MTDYLKRINGGVDLYPPFQDKILQLCQKCESLGWVYLITSGVRTYKEQAKIYAIGRTTDENGKIISMNDSAYGHIRTKAKPGQSPHNFGVSVDACHDQDNNLDTGLQPDYKDENYQVWAQEGQKLGLEPGLYWPTFPDTPHMQLPVKAHGLSWALLDQAYQTGGYVTVFKILDSHGPW